MSRTHSTCIDSPALSDTFRWRGHLCLPLHDVHCVHLRSDNTPERLVAEQLVIKGLSVSRSHVCTYKISDYHHVPLSITQRHVPAQRKQECSWESVARLRTWHGTYLAKGSGNTVTLSRNRSMALEVTLKANSDGTLSFKTRDGEYLTAWSDAPHLRLMPHNLVWEHWDLQVVLCDSMWYSL
ncbi:hypothetical protein HYH03_018602 [Edaphochlamys debaryana]|uniref:Uncharacterized protein n=1 Tax=Edaphochlamys debaryana TaxID=47281 RepID=A0A835XGQ0_9CHLO|nr:hypothetical protein HYH03_018602 [Edaphochlamys debaryana]|eukprot:KAG2482468.1 hypothetical protein HYH03_018602 [Edaphochlamys debaryana]